MYPGLAVAEDLREQAADAGLGLELIWAATPRAVDQRLLTKFGDQYVKQPVQPLVTSIKKLWGFVQGWRASCAMWRERLDRGEIDAVVALGGYGRRELFPYSDVDLLYLLDGKVSEKELKQPIRRISQELWDCGIRLSPQTRKRS